MGAQSATGLGAKLAERNTIGNNGVRSQDYFSKKEQLDKTNRFLQFEGKVLRFKCVETNGGGSGTGRLASSTTVDGNKEFALYYYLSDDSVEVRCLKSKKTCLDDVNVLLRRGKVPKNWREMARGVKMEYYTAEDLICGALVDCFGRYFMVLDCDEPTRDIYARMGIEQNPIERVIPRDIPIEHEIPKLGDGFLPIGGHHATLATVYGQNIKEGKNWKKVSRNQNRFIRCRAKMITEDGINKTRNFTITFFLEDDTLSVYEDVKRNSGLVGGNFLKRGVYVNGLPPDSDVPRNFVATDIYLGNVVQANGLEFRIIEMDELSVDFCESCPDEFPFFDAFQIASGILHKVVQILLYLLALISNVSIASKVVRNKIDLRFLMASSDPTGKGWISDEAFVRMLDDTGLAEKLNDQEMLTIMRRFMGVGGLNSKERKQYYYNELVDLFSHIHAVSMAGTRQKNQQQQDLFLQSLRGRSTQWRRVLRLEADITTGRYLTLKNLIQFMERLGARVSTQNEASLVLKFSVKDAQQREAILKVLAARNPALAISSSSASLNASNSSSGMLGSRPQSANASSSVELRRSLILQNRGLSAANFASASDRNDSDTVIDYYALCDAIYPCDWM